MEEEALSSQNDELTPMSEHLLEVYDYRELRRGEIRTGVVISKAEDHLVVDIGVKREGIVPASDLQRLDEDYLEGLREGDEVPVYVVRPEGREGEVVLSINLARTAQDWEHAQALMESGEVIEVEVVGYNKGGVLVNFGMLQGFIPRSHLMRLGPAGQSAKPEQLAKLRGEIIPVEVIEVNRRQRRLIMSERAAWPIWRQQQKERLLEELQPGEIRKGRVTSLSDFGAFVDLGGADGLIHVSELSWDRNVRPEDVLECGQEVEVYVLNVDRQRRRIGLSLKRLKPDPWLDVEIKYLPGEIVEGTITNVVKFGAFARLEEGIEGLIHLSELADWHVNDPTEVVHPGERHRIKVLSVDPERRRISLSLRQAPQPTLIEAPAAEAPQEETAPTTFAEAPQEVEASTADVEEQGATEQEPTPAVAQEVPSEPPPQEDEQPVASTPKEIVSEQPEQVVAAEDVPGEEPTGETPPPSPATASTSDKGPAEGAPAPSPAVAESAPTQEATDPATQAPPQEADHAPSDG